MSEDGHRVAWKDRIGLNQQWALDLRSCAESYGRDKEYGTAVDRLRHDIINIHGGPQLKDIVENYIDTVLRDYAHKQYLNEKKVSAIYKSNTWEHDIAEESRKATDKMLYRFILQLLEDNGFAFYESEFTGEYDKME